MVIVMYFSCALCFHALVQASDSDMKTKWLAALVDTDVWQASKDASKDLKESAKTDLLRLRERVRLESSQVDQLRGKVGEALQEERGWQEKMEEQKVRGWGLVWEGGPGDGGSV